MKNIFNYALILLNIWVLIKYPFNYETEKIHVEIKGMVKSPGVYEINYNNTVLDVINLSGGLNENADTSITNLSKKLNDGDVIIIYSNDEVNEMKNGSTTVKYIDKECICPMIDNKALFIDSVNNVNSIINKTGKVSLNSSTIEELLTLPGIGESKAKLIIEYREKNNGFKMIEEIMNVKGIGNSSFEKIKSYLTL